MRYKQGFRDSNAGMTLWAGINYKGERRARRRRVCTGPRRGLAVYWRQDVRYAWDMSASTAHSQERRPRTCQTVNYPSSSCCCRHRCCCCCNSPPPPLFSSRIVEVEEMMLDDAGDDTRKAREGEVRSRLQPLCRTGCRRVQTSTCHAKACCWRYFNGRRTSRPLVPPCMKRWIHLNIVIVVAVVSSRSWRDSS